jgi:hypothetical protein
VDPASFSPPAGKDYLNGSSIFGGFVEPYELKDATIFFAFHDWGRRSLLVISNKASAFGVDSLV